MSLFQCENCGCAENTALSSQGFSYVELFDWGVIPHLKGKKLCSSCGPTRYSDGTPTDKGKWHGEFERVWLPKGKFKTNREGNLEHIETGDTDFRRFRIGRPDVILVGGGVWMGRLSEAVAIAAMTIPFVIAGSQQPFFTDRQPRRLPSNTYPVRKESDLQAIERAKTKRERKAKKRLENSVRQFARY